MRMPDCIRVPDILLPREGIDRTKWAVVACDQFTSQPEYWDEAERIVGGAPSTLRLIHPEARLLQRPDEDPAEEIHRAMRGYLAGNVFAPERRQFVLTERTTRSGRRLGLMALVDLAAYDYTPGSRPLIRPTEGTVLSRLPARVRVRSGAALELPHLMLLADDPQRTLIEPLYAQREKFEKLYDFELMLGGGHLRGWAVDGADGVLAAMDRLPSLQGDDPILFAVGDGNHSMAAACKCWLEHPTERNRYMLAEVVNLYDESLRFEPIHRLLRGEGLDAVWRKAAERGVQLDGGDVRKVQPFLDETLDSSVQVDYIHGAQALEKLAAQPGCRGIALKAIAKETLFPSLKGGKTLPRKAFSMGEAQEKRYYMEAREI